MPLVPPPILASAASRAGRFCRTAAGNAAVQWAALIAGYVAVFAGYVTLLIALVIPDLAVTIARGLIIAFAIAGTTALAVIFGRAAEPASTRPRSSRAVSAMPPASADRGLLFAARVTVIADVLEAAAREGSDADALLATARRDAAIRLAFSTEALDLEPDRGTDLVAGQAGPAEPGHSRSLINGWGTSR